MISFTKFSISKDMGLMVKTILLMRHAAAENGHGALRDFDRALTDDGQAIAQQTGDCLKSLRIRWDRTVASSSVRTQQTAELVASVAAPSSVSTLLNNLYNGSADAFVSAIARECDPEESSVLVVGHNPGIAELMCEWAGQILPVPPATLIVFQTEASQWSDLRRPARLAIKLICIVQDGEITRQDSEYKTTSLPKESR